MTVRIVRLGKARHPQEGLRIGTVRHLPRGVPKAKYASDNWFDVWYPDLAPSAELVKAGRTATSKNDWDRFVRSYKRAMNEPSARRLIDLLAALSHSANFSVGCYCEDESRCHRSVLRDLLKERGAKLD